jgi:hypothetical protein
MTLIALICAKKRRNIDKETLFFMKKYIGYIQYIQYIFLIKHETMTSTR